MKPDVKDEVLFYCYRKLQSDKANMQAEWSYPLNISRGDLLLDIYRQFYFFKSYKPYAMVTRYHEVIKLDEYRKMPFKFLMLTLWKAVKMAEGSV